MFQPSCCPLWMKCSSRSTVSMEESMRTTLLLARMQADMYVELMKSINLRGCLESHLGFSSTLGTYHNNMARKKIVQFECLCFGPGTSLCLWCKGDIFLIPDILFIRTSVFKLLDFFLTACLKQSYICLGKHTHMYYVNIYIY